MKKLLLFFLFWGILKFSSAQIDSSAMNLIAEDLDLEMFENNYTFHIDTLVKTNGFFR